VQKNWEPSLGCLTKWSYHVRCETSDRARAEDQILDLMIAAEALFLPEESGELSYRLALRGAHFLGTELGSRTAVYQFLRNAYAVRSKIAHGSPPDAGKLQTVGGERCKGPHAFAQELARVLRAALRKAVSSGARFPTSEQRWGRLLLGEDS